MRAVVSGRSSAVRRPLSAVRRLLARPLAIQYNSKWEGMCPGGRPGLQNQWQAAQSRLRWVRLPRLPAYLLLNRCFYRDTMTEISLFDEDEPLLFKRILIYPYPDLKRLWVRVWLPAKQGMEPNIELRLYNPDGSENNSLLLLAQTDARLNNTLHLKEPVLADATYRMEAELSLGFAENLKVVDRRTFDVVLEFRNPEAGEVGFGIGLDDLFSEDQENA